MNNIEAMLMPSGKVMMVREVIIDLPATEESTRGHLRDLLVDVAHEVSRDDTNVFPGRIDIQVQRGDTGAWMVATVYEAKGIH
jgi:hypothetical protein